MGEEQAEEKKLTGKITVYFTGDSELGTGYLVELDDEKENAGAIALGSTVELTMRISR